MKYKALMGKKLDLQEPKSFNEKLQWLKLYDRNPLYTNLVDKFAVKEFIAVNFGSKYIIPTLGVWENPNDIDWDTLPTSFVLKVTHDSGGIIICRNKLLLNKEAAVLSLKKSLKRDFYMTGREWPYKNVPRKIIAEKYIENENGEEIRDYKFFCFHGEAKFLYVSEGLNDHSTATISFYDFDGKELPFRRSDYNPFARDLDFPENFSEMKNLAEAIAKLISAVFVRVDLYSIGDNIYFSEITFFPCSGMIPFDPESWDFTIGSWLSLPKNI